MSDCATCARAKRKNRLLMRLAKALSVMKYRHTDYDSDALAEEARKEAGR